MSVIRVCQGCLSVDRNLLPLGKHAKLYQTLLKTKSMPTDKKQWLFCWECHKVLDNVHAFRLKITQAQRLLNDNSMVHYNTLSNLTLVNISNDYKLIVHEDIIDTALELEMDNIKREKKEEIETETLAIEKDDENHTTNVKQLCDVKVEIGGVKVEGDFDDLSMMDDFENDNDIKLELDEPLIDIAALEGKDGVVVKRASKRRKFLKKKYKTIIIQDIQDKRSLYDKVKIDQKTLEEWIEKKRKATSRKKYQCERCYCGFSRQEFYERHLAVRHAKRLGVYECDTCGFRFAEKRRLARHVRGHWTAFACRVCGAACASRAAVYLHLAAAPHARRRQCRRCPLSFDVRKRKEFFDHYRYAHETHICDYCGKNFRKKTRLILHINKHHTIHRCKVCSVTYNSLDSYNRHCKEKHVVDASEQNYCVECNVQFINSAKYNGHLKRSVKHRPTPAIPCPECGKIYTKNCSMMNHYNLVHLKKSKYHCDVCDTYYLTGHRLRYHQRYFHEKRPKPKNKLCKYCGKGFNNNRMLDNHIRTHTGERPFSCAHCPAAFTQKQSLAAHARAAHK